MSPLLDTSVLLDVLLQREPWVAEAAPIWEANRQGTVALHLSSSALTDVFYIARRLVGTDAARAMVRICLDELQIVSVDAEDAEAAFTLPMRDFEDALQAAEAMRHRLTCVVTRDPAGFVSSPVPAFSPVELLARLGA